MRNRTFASILTLALLAAACGGGAQSTPEPGSTPTDRSATTETSTVISEPSEVTTTLSASPSTVGAPTAAAGTLGAFLAAAPNSTPQAQPLSARFDARIELEVEDDQGELQNVDIAFAGAYDQRTLSSDVTVDMSGLADLGSLAVTEEDEFAAMFLAMFTEPMRVITIGDVSWVQWGFFSSFLGADEGKWIESESDGAQAMNDFGFGTAGGTPVDFLSALADAHASVTEIGPDEVRGWQTTHYRAMLDVEALAAEATPEERAELEASIGAGLPAELPMDLWIGDDGYLYRFTMQIDASESPEQLDGLAHMSMTFEMYDYDEPIDIVPPDPADVLAEDELGFGFGAGG